MCSAVRWFGVASLVVAAAGCHKYVPVDASTPPVGDIVAFHISDQGRVGLQERLGPGIAAIKGRVVGAESDVFLVSVSGVESLNGTDTPWSGEVMRLDRGFVSHVRRREFSTTRTLLLAGGITTAVVVFIASRGFSAIFGDDSNGNGDPPEQSRGRPFRP